MNTDAFFEGYFSKQASDFYLDSIDRHVEELGITPMYMDEDGGNASWIEEIGHDNVMEIDKRMRAEGWGQDKEAKVELDLEIGDVILTGRYKNKRKVVESLGTDSLGQPTVNGMKLLALRIEKKLPKSKQSAETQRQMSKQAGFDFIDKLKRKAEDTWDNTKHKIKNIGKKTREAAADIVHPYGDDRPKEIRGYNPDTEKIDMVENLRGVYGDRTEEVLARADEMARRGGLPIRMGKGYQEPVKLDKRAPLQRRIGPAYYNTEPAINFGGFPGEHIGIGKGPKGLMDAIQTVGAGPTGRAMGLENTKGLDPYKTWQDVLRHEMSHAASLRPWTEDNKTKQSFEIMAAMGQGLSGNPKNYEENIAARGDDKVYGELASPELIPPLSALKQWHFKNTGDIMETKQYDQLMNQVDSMNTLQRHDFMSKLPSEVRRHFEYRDVIQNPMQSTKDMQQRLQNYLGEVRGMSPEERKANLAEREENRGPLRLRSSEDTLRDYILEDYDNLRLQRSPEAVDKARERLNKKYKFLEDLERLRKRRANRYRNFNRKYIPAVADKGKPQQRRRNA